jgi:hypothetical protein
MRPGGSSGAPAAGQRRGRPVPRVLQAVVPPASTGTARDANELAACHPEERLVGILDGGIDSLIRRKRITHD